MKNFIQWNYGRGTWQYDIFCLLIVAFIFLTPKEWFDKRERLATRTTRHVVKVQDFSPEKDETRKRIENLIGNPNADNGSFYETDRR